MLTEILTQLGTTAVVMALAGWLGKTWITHQLSDLQKRNEHQLAIELEAARARWAKDIARLNVHETYLHRKRVDLLEEMYAQMLEAEYSLQRFFLGWWAHSNEEELLERGLAPTGSVDGEQGKSIEARGYEFCEHYLKINATLHRNSLFFAEPFIERISEAYSPFCETILKLNYKQLPQIPEDFKDVVNAGRAPRRVVVDLFREMLGVGETRPAT